MPGSVDTLRTVVAVTKNNAAVLGYYALEMIRFLQEKLWMARDTSNDLSVNTRSGALESWNVLFVKEASPANSKDSIVRETAVAGVWFWIGGGFDLYKCGVN